MRLRKIFDHVSYAKSYIIKIFYIMLFDSELFVPYVSFSPFSFGRFWKYIYLYDFDNIVLAYADHMLVEENIEAFLPHLKVFYDKFPYTIINNNERHYQAVMFMILTYIFELKYKKDVDAAMAQIEQKDYAKTFADDDWKVVKVGLNFSEDQRSIEDWEVEEWNKKSRWFLIGRPPIFVII